MADGLPPRPPSANSEPPREPGAPPPLTDVRVRGPGAKGLNKPAILLAVGGGVAIVLLLASNGLASDPSKRPTDVKPIMSAPARPESAQSAVRDLPATYEQAAIQQAARAPAQPPLLGPPLPGDIAAFAPNEPQPQASNFEHWSAEPASEPNEPADPQAVEAEEAERSELFFELRQEPKPATASIQHPASPPRNPMTALRQAPPDPVGASTAATRVLFPGTVISASLVTEINSESPGPVIAQITQAVHDSATGRTLLIPQGARLIGDYKSSARYGQSRIAILWSRIVMPDGAEIALDEVALDPSGAAGVAGPVDNHWAEVFGAAALGTLINIGVASAEDPHLTYGGIGIVTRDPVDQAINEGIQRSANLVTSRVVDRSLAIPPTIRIEAGKRIAVIVTRRTTLPPADR